MAGLTAAYFSSAASLSVSLSPHKFTRQRHFPLFWPVSLLIWLLSLLSLGRRRTRAQNSHLHSTFLAEGKVEIRPSD